MRGTFKNMSQIIDVKTGKVLLDADLKFEYSFTDASHDSDDFLEYIKVKNNKKKEVNKTMINITDTKETLDNLEVPVFTTAQETCEVKEFAEPENVHQNLELPKFMETK